MTIKSSFDGLETWTNAKLIHAGPSAYSSMARLPNGNVGLFFEMGRESPYEEMVFLSFSPSSLFAPGSLR
jgi:sialidase-1